MLTDVINKKKIKSILSKKYKILQTNNLHQSEQILTKVHLKV